MLELIKFLSIISAAIFGVYGSLVNFRDETGKVTKHGKVGVCGVLISACIGGGLQIYSDIQSEKQSLDLLKRNTEILTEINRSLHPLDGMTVEYIIEPDWSIPEFKEIFNKIESGFEHATSFGGTFYSGTEPDFAVLEDTLCKVSIELFFFKEKIDTSKFKYRDALAAGELGEDLRVDIPNPCKWKFLAVGNNDRIINLDYDLRSSKLLRLSYEVSAQKTDSNSRDWRGNGRMISLSDLPNSQLIIQLSSSGIRAGTPLSNEKIMELRKSIILRGLVIRLPNGIVMGFDRDNLKAHKNNYHHYFYSFDFPKSKNEIINRTHYDDFKLLRIKDI